MASNATTIAAGPRGSAYIVAPLADLAEDKYKHKYLIAIAVTLAAVLELIDTSIVNVAIPHMMGNLGATIDEISWVSTGYIIANVIVIPMSGWLSAYFGRRRYLTGSIMDNYNGPWIFYINVPLGIPAAIMVMSYVRNAEHQERAEKIDVWGILFLAMTVGSLQWMLERGERYDWFDSRFVTGLAVTAAVSAVSYTHLTLPT